MRALALMLLLAACSRPQHEVTLPGALLTADGRLREPGWARRQLLDWDATRVADAGKLRQWDFFTVMSDAAAVNVTLTDLGFARTCTVGVVDFASNTTPPGAVMLAGAADDFTLSAAVEGSARFTPAAATAPVMTLSTRADGGQIDFDVPAALGVAAEGSLALTRRPAMPYLSLATPFTEEAHLFFFEQKLQGMAAAGSVTLGGQTWTFPDGSVAIMDWGRGAWPSSVTWRWAGASGVAGGKTLALNFGEGFGDASAGSENLLVYDDVAHKLAQVAWTHDPVDDMRDWTFAAPDGRVALVLHPLAKEVSALDLGDRFQHVHKAYGRFAGSVVLDDGTRVAVDGLLGFAEEVSLAW